MFSTIFFLKLSLALFIGHGFCDFVPLIQTMGALDFALYIFLIPVNIYLYAVNPGMSTLIFLILSGIHFSGDFEPYNAIKLPGLGFYILGYPILLNYNYYLGLVTLLEIPYPNILCYLLISGSILSVIDPIFNKNRKIIDWTVHIMCYSLAVYYIGPIAQYLYFVTNHLVISLYELVLAYRIRDVMFWWIIGSVLSGIVIWNISSNTNTNTHININGKNLKYIIGGMFGLLNSHSLTTLYWRHRTNKKNI